MHIAMSVILRFFINLGPDNYIYKCLGNKHVTDELEEVTTLFVVIPTALINGNLNVGNVLVGNSSNGFLEAVNEIVEEEKATFVYTELAICSSGFSSSKK